VTAVREHGRGLALPMVLARSRNSSTEPARATCHVRSRTRTASRHTVRQFTDPRGEHGPLMRCLKESSAGPSHPPDRAHRRFGRRGV